jgi:N-acetylmuramidase
MDRLGLRIISSNLGNEYNFDQETSVFNANIRAENRSQQRVFHLPATISFNDYEDNNRIKNSIENILGNITHNIETYGYSVILLHPQDFMKLDMEGNLTDTLDENEIKDLSNLIDLILSRNIDIASFSNIVGIDPKIYASTPNMNASILGASDRIPLEGLKELEYSMANIYNEYGKYIHQKASEIGISPSAAAAVLYVESGGSGFGTDGRMTIRFEACTFYDIWGKEHDEEFSTYFQCNKPNDKFRTMPTDQFRNYHNSHLKEWEAFELARNLDEDSAIKSISMGLAQIMGFNYDKIGYASVIEMYNNMSDSIKSQLDAFFSYITYRDSRGISCLDSLKSNNYVAFAGCYNAAGQDNRYGSEISKAVKAYKEVTSGKIYSDK